MYVNEENCNLWDFEVLADVDFLNCNRVHPLKQKDLNKLVKVCADDVHIKEILVFGSAVKFRCNSKSDIDLVILRDDDKKEVPHEFMEVDSELDILFTVGERLAKILYEEGVVVYRG